MLSQLGFQDEHPNSRGKATGSFVIWSCIGEGGKKTNVDFQKTSLQKRFGCITEFRIKLKNLALKNYISFLIGLIFNWHLFLMETDISPIQYQPHFGPFPAWPTQAVTVCIEASPPTVFPPLSVQPGQHVRPPFRVQVRIPSLTWQVLATQLPP